MTSDSLPPISPALSRWLDGECTAQEDAQVRARLAADPDLAARVALWRDAMEAWKHDAPVLAPGLSARVLSRLPAGDVERLRFERWARRTAAAAAVLLVAGTAGILSRERSDDRRVARSAPASAGIEDHRFTLARRLGLDGLTPLPSSSRPR